jgi:hypothetical protein
MTSAYCLAYHINIKVKDMDGETEFTGRLQWTAPILSHSQEVMDSDMA